jgi:nucleoside-diphosphate-sugar epimerase
MITLIGHGYIGEAIATKLKSQSSMPFYWVTHKDKIPNDTKVLINAGGYTGSPNSDACEHHKEDTIRGNVLWPLELESKCLHIPVIHITSGCVYTGYQKDFTEEDEPNLHFDNGSFYSASKALGQKLLTPYLGKSYLLRIRLVFGSSKHPKNLLTKLENYPKLIDFRQSLSYIEDIADAVLFFITNKPQPGIYNVTNGGSTSLKEIVDMMKLNKEWLTEEQFLATVKTPRSNCILDNTKLKRVFPIRDLDIALKDAILKYQSNLIF